MVSDFDLGATLRQVRRLTPQLARLPRATRDKAIQVIAKQLIEQRDQILEANTFDLERIRGHHSSDWLLDCMKLTPERLQRSADYLNALAKAPDPIGVPDRHWRSPDGTLYSRYRVPLGLLAVVYEMYPEYAISAVSMAIKSGNGIVLSSSGDLSQTHETLISLLSEAAYAGGIPECAIQPIPDVDPLLETAQSTPLLQQSRYLDLVIPCGRPNWVESITTSCSAPVLITRLGHGHVYIDQATSWQHVQTVLLNSLGQYVPDAIPIIQPDILWILVHEDWAQTHLNDLITDLTHRGFMLQVGSKVKESFPQFSLINEVIDSAEQPHLRLQLVTSLTDVITWINKNGQGQSEAILSNAESSIQRFVQEIDAAIIYVNSSPLPAKGSAIPVFGSQIGISLGTSVQKTHTRGPITLDALTTIKYVATGTVRFPGSNR